MDYYYKLDKSSYQRVGEQIVYYVKENGWYYNKLHGPYETLQEAMANKPSDLTGGREEAHVRYTIESTEGSVRLLNE